MGSTVSTSKLMGAFRDKNGQPYYVMFEQSYEKNVYPHTPTWCARALGGLETMLEAIFGTASACEGGMLQGVGGRSITPEGYIAGWLKELENPAPMFDLQFELKVSTGWSATITKDHLEACKQSLLALGYESQVAALEAGDAVSMSLYADSEVLSVLYNGKAMGASRIIPSYNRPERGICDASLGFKPQKVKAYDVAAPRCMRVSKGNENVLIQNPDGSWRCAGWAYSIIGEFVTDLWKAELREPGSFRVRIKALREAVSGAPTLPTQGVTVVVDTSVPVHGYQQRSLEDLLSKVTHTRAGDEVRFRVPDDDSMLYTVTNFPMANTKWVINQTAHVPAPFEQLSLLG